MSSSPSILIHMLLTEPGSRVEAEAEEFLHTVFQTTWDLLRESLSEDDADKIALRHLGRVHGALADRGWIVRDVGS